MTSSYNSPVHGGGAVASSTDLLSLQEAGSVSIDKCYINLRLPREEETSVATQRGDGRHVRSKWGDVPALAPAANVVLPVSRRIWKPLRPNVVLEMGL
ncbi:hypothetical protein EVAR_63180_1 [Eumeta japonica]|uniref:Uncharacterized protein n=1 Tax=Eumeta variegata TaxID=151549 RepID=A0A4C1YYY1_EUMVA|nr:hypothetical protein EVAR_63180_1 [Eumeta japonica]